MQVHCKYDELVDVSKLRPHPKNRNNHPEDQIVRLAKIIAYQGLRAPIVVSKQSGFIVKGHGTLTAIRHNGVDKAPVVYQNFDTEDQEYAFVQSDNAIASWSDIDFSGINSDLPDLGPDFDIDFLGIKNFVLDMFEKVNEVNKGNENDAWVGMPDFELSDKDIKLTLVFETEEQREKYVEDNNIPITAKHSKQWTARL